MYVLIPKQLRKGKLYDVGLLVYFVGNSEIKKEKLFYDPSTGKVNTSRDTSPIHHVYELRLDDHDKQQGEQIFPPLCDRSHSHQSTRQPADIKAQPQHSVVNDN